MEMNFEVFLLLFFVANLVDGEQVKIIDVFWK